MRLVPGFEAPLKQCQNDATRQRVAPYVQNLTIGPYSSVIRVTVNSLFTSAVFGFFGLAGQYYDDETGLHNNLFRYYDPSIGRYLRTDPIGLAGGVNLYAYVINNPLKFVDPWGLKISRSQGVKASIVANVVTATAVGTVVLAGGGAIATVFVPAAIVSYGFNVFTSAAMTAYYGGDEADIWNSIINASLGSTVSTFFFPGGFLYGLMMDFGFDMVLAGSEPLIKSECE